MFPIGIEVPEAAAMPERTSSIPPGSKSSLAQPIKDLISMLFDVNSINRTLVSMELDVSKMPLGQLSKKQIQSGYKVLGDAMNELGKKSWSKSRILELSNQFYTLVRLCILVMDPCSFV
jgi:poly [ADP-ribose] polymerase